MSRLMIRTVYTVSIIQGGYKILLGFKKTGFGEGKWGGFGGTVQENESPTTSAVREIKAESGLEVETQNLRKVGALEFEFIGKPGVMLVHVFTTTIFTGEITESEEFLPKWFDITEIPFDRMWPDDKQWLPMVITDQKFHAYFLYDDDENILVKRMKVVPMLDR